MKVIAFQELREGELLRKANEVDSAEFRKPSTIEVDDSLFGIENLEDLFFICLRIAIDLFARERLARCRTAAGIANQTSEIADEEDGGVPHILKVLQFAN